MKRNFEVLKKCSLFAGISEDDMELLISCLKAKEIRAKKGEAIFNAGDRSDYIGIILKGSVHVVQDDYWGKRTILTDVQEGGLFGESFSCAEASVLPVSVLAREEVTFLLLDCKKISITCSSTCMFHARLIRNMMKTLANKNIMLTRKIEHITKKTTRERVLSYLSECAIEKGSNRFTLSFNRQELADYLSVERSALSNTLCKMRDDGEIEFKKNKFKINTNPCLKSL